MVAVDWAGGMGILRISCGHGDGCLSELGVSGEWGGAIEAGCDRELRQSRSLKTVGFFALMLIGGKILMR